MSRDFAFIKPFRAIAAFWVISAHSIQWWGAYIPTHFPAPKMAVDLFVIISGYLMAANAFSRDSYEPMSEPRGWLRFWTRRYFRVAPAYYLALGLVILLSSFYLQGYQNLIHMAYGHAMDGTYYDPAMVHYSPTNILMHLSFLYGLSPTYASSTYLPDWTLSLEMQFYFTFPWLFLLLRRFNFAVPAALIGFPVFVLGLMVSQRVHFPEPTLMVMKLNYFIAGIILYRVVNAELSEARRAAMSLLAIALVSIDYRYHLHLLVLPTAMALMLFLGRLETQGKTPRWLAAVIGSKIVTAGADTSYSVYLFHGFFIATAGLLVAGNEAWIAEHRQLFNWSMYAFVVICAYALASVVYRFVELPGIQWGKRVINKLPKPLPRNDSAAPVRQDAVAAAPGAGN